MTEMAASELTLDARGVFSLQHPLSRGYLEITSNDPFVYPSIDIRYVSNPLDMDIHVDTIRFLRKVMATSEVAAMGWNEAQPGLRQTTDEELKAFVVERIASMAHSCCTNPMQPLALGGVVDSKLKVYGTTNLRYESCFEPDKIGADEHNAEWLTPASCP
jgi:choline dehydrogenase-like flavoprotein